MKIIIEAKPEYRDQMSRPLFEVDFQISEGNRLYTDPFVIDHWSEGDDETWHISREVLEHLFDIIVDGLVKDSVEQATVHELMPIDDYYAEET